METQVERSAGGVLFKPMDGGPLVCLIKVATRGGNPSWRLPKGTIEPGETPEDAAIRETREETGCLGRIISTLSPIDYWYTRHDDSGRHRIQKSVAFYLMEYISGDVADHDHEVLDVEFMTLAQAVREISYDAENRVLQEAMHAWDAHLYRQSLT
ncbi:NUDIX hydrolase [Microvenator marinus]|jgi:8-oxo-dGTP pyrophosphatase MutT (NUDIX family)|nr:NUDIX hydrolase [Microvenator marinus]